MNKINKINKIKNRIIVCLGIALLIVTLVLCGCTSCEASCKNWEIGQDGLSRCIRVYDARTGETLYEFNGISYIVEGSTKG